MNRFVLPRLALGMWLAPIESPKSPMQGNRISEGVAEMYNYEPRRQRSRRSSLQRTSFLSGALTFLEDGLHATVTIERKAP
jgi:hypothetical protein